MATATSTPGIVPTACTGYSPGSACPESMRGQVMSVPYWRAVLPVLVIAVTLGAFSPVSAAPEGTMTWGVHITLASRWLDPAETEGIITPFMVLYGLHD